MSVELTLAQKQGLYRDGYVILRNAISSDMVEAALTCLRNSENGELPYKEKAMTDLVNASSVTPILNEAMGQFDPPIAAQIGVLPVVKPSESFNERGYRDMDMPYYGAVLHVDGQISVPPPQEPITVTPEEIYLKQIATLRNGHLGRSADVIGRNMVPLFMDPAMTLAIGNFTAFVIVCLNDQMKPGCGQTSVLQGAHHAAEKFFQWQRSVNDHLGAEGPGWPRFDYSAPSGCGLVHLPDGIIEQFIDDTSESTPDGKCWPRPTQMLMNAGDVCITTYHIPHGRSRNEKGNESRKNIIFRIRNKKRQPDKRVNGITDHPDRGQYGEWLEYEEGNDPWERSKDAICDMWDEWEGMTDVVNAEVSP